ncbi:hypothetical protein MRB53_008846 [Persea americana]|uniref:Uncharacterized protein n=1 Tax=Persea americana TaxID=3435 RepID=A0ACC2LMC0_PERAE|nr:hypothetical protein MRB53_008846 [Persea americana]
MRSGEQVRGENLCCDLGLLYIAAVWGFSQREMARLTERGSRRCCCRRYYRRGGSSETRIGGEDKEGWKKLFSLI